MHIAHALKYTFDFVRSIAPGQIVRGGSEREETQQQDEVMEVRITQMSSLNNSPIQVSPRCTKWICLRDGLLSPLDVAGTS